MNKLIQGIKNGFTKVQNTIMLRSAGVEDDTEFVPGDHLLEVLGVIIIAVVLLILFRNTIVTMFTNAMNETNNKFNALWGNLQ